MANSGGAFDSAIGLEVYPGQDNFNQEIDEELSRVDALIRYCYSPYWNQRLVFIQGIAAVVQDSNIVEIRQQIVPLIGELLQDDVPQVKVAVLGQIADIGRNLVARNGSNGCWEIEQLLPPVAELVRDENESVQEYALSALADVWAMVKQPKRIQLACLVVEDLAMDSNSNARISACRLLTQMSNAMDESDVKQCGQYAIALAQDEDINVRQVSVECLVALAAFESIRSKVMDRFWKLCTDSTWSVRQACALALQKTAQFYPNEQKLTRIMYEFCRDQSKWVQAAMLQNLMPVVALVKPEIRGQEWLEHFIRLISMKVPVLQQEQLEHSWAYQLPAVVKLAGRQVWPLLKQHYLRIVDNGTPKARHSIASSLPTLRSLLLENTGNNDRTRKVLQNSNNQKLYEEELSNEMIQQELIPVMEKLCFDEDSSVRIQAMYGAAQWIAELEFWKDKLAFIEVLQKVVRRKEGQINCRDWRVALVLAQQLYGILQTVHQDHPHAQELIKQLVQHPVAAVRSEAQNQVNQLTN